MSRVRVGIAAVMVVGLATLLGVVWAGSRTPSTAAAPVATTSTTSTTSPEPPTTRETTTTATVADREAEVQQILRHLWFGWFDAIYRKDPDALWKVVATKKGYEEGVAAMDVLAFTRPPDLAGVRVTLNAVLLDRADCLVAYENLDVRSFAGPSSQGDSVDVLWSDDGTSWRIATLWKSPEDLWLQDCDALNRGSSP